LWFQLGAITTVAWVYLALKSYSDVI